MRKAWTDHVGETRRKGNRGKKSMTHREAMKAASVTWPKVKAKLERRQRKQGVLVTKPRVQKASEKSDESESA